MVTRRLMATAAGAAILAVLTTASTRAAISAERTTLVTFKHAVSLPGVELTPGSYIFELAQPGQTMNLVRVMSRDRRQIYLTSFTLLVQRPDNLETKHMIVMHESRAGTAPAVKAWYPEGDTEGRQFIYR